MISLKKGTNLVTGPFHRYPLHHLFIHNILNCSSSVTISHLFKVPQFGQLTSTKPALARTLNKCEMVTGEEKEKTR